MQLKFLLCFLWGLVTFSVEAQQAQQVVEYGIDFTIKNAGIGVKGNLEGLKANIYFDPKQPETCVIEATADAGTIDTGIGARDKHLKREDYFDVENHPKIKLTLQQLKPTEQAGSFQATFDVLIKGVTKTVTAPLQYSIDGDLYKISSTFSLNRLDFKVGKKSFILSRNVKVSLSATLK